MVNVDENCSLLGGTPYSLEAIAEQKVIQNIQLLEERVSILRDSTVMSEDTLKSYYGEKRFEQVAESNAIEGSTLSVGETELAVRKGITITGHDPAYIRDAIALNTALERLAEMAKERDTATDIKQLLELHQLILGDRRGSGTFRTEPVRIKHVPHIPPETWNAVICSMEQWEAWSRSKQKLSVIIRCAVLHAWLAHIHPFIDGNGRAARAISNLELVRAGYPPIIIRKKERTRYIEALSESDEGGDIRSLLELIIQRTGDALTGLELSAKKAQGYNPDREKITNRQKQNLKIWETSVSLLIQTMEYYLLQHVEQVRGTVYIKEFPSIDLEEYIAVTQRHSISQSWCFIVNIALPAGGKLERLAYVGYRQDGLCRKMKNKGGPAIYWSTKNPTGYPKWPSDDERAPYCTVMTTAEDVGDKWVAKQKNKRYKTHTTTELARNIARELFHMVAKARE